MRPGDDAAAIESAIRGSRRLLVVVSLASAGSVWVEREIQVAESLGVRVLPVLPEDVPGAMADRVSRAAPADFRQAREYRRATHRLIAAIEDRPARGGSGGVGVRRGRTLGGAVHPGPAGGREARSGAAHLDCRVFDPTLTEGVRAVSVDAATATVRSHRTRTEIVNAAFLPARLKEATGNIVIEGAGLFRAIANHVWGTSRCTSRCPWAQRRRCAGHGREVPAGAGRSPAVAAGSLSTPE
jgi:hypothetical protein